MTDTVAQITQRLAALNPVSVDIRDESAAHAGHAGAASGGGHYQVTIVSAAFTGLSPLARHRRVYDLLAEMMQRDIHALKLKALTPDECN